MKTSDAKKQEIETLQKEFQAIADSFQERAKKLTQEYAMALIEEALPTNTKQFN